MKTNYISAQQNNKLKKMGFNEPCYGKILWQDAFDWIREEYSLIFHPIPTTMGGYTSNYLEINENGRLITHTYIKNNLIYVFESYYEARSKTLDLFLKIIAEKKEKVNNR